MDGMHFLSVGIHKGQSAGLDTDALNGIPTSSFWNLLCVRHDLQALVFRLLGSHDKNTILYENDHKELINIPLPNVCTSLPCSAV